MQQSGGASPIVQKIGSPVVQQNNAPAAAYVVQQTPTVVQHINWPAAPSVPAGPVIDQGGESSWHSHCVSDLENVQSCLFFSGQI